jgi:Flp pilus assembly protein TadD
MTITGRRRELRFVLVLWSLLLATALVCLWLLNANAVRLINHIEYVKASRYKKAQALYAEADKYTRKALETAAALNAKSAAKVLLPATDPNYRKALDAFQRALSLDPRPASARELRTSYEKIANLYEAVGADADRMRLLTRAFLCDANYKDAETYARALAARSPKDSQPWRLLAETYIMSDQLTLVDPVISRLETLNASAWEVHELRGDLAFRRGNNKEAATEYAAAVEAAPKRLELRKRLMECLNLLGRTDEAASAMAGGVPHGGDEDGNYMHLYGQLLIKCGKPRDAVQALLTAAQLEKGSGSIQWDLARAYQRAGREADANKALNTALKLDPELRKQVFEK